MYIAPLVEGEITDIYHVHIVSCSFKDTGLISIWLVLYSAWENHKIVHYLKSSANMG